MTLTSEKADVTPDGSSLGLERRPFVTAADLEHRPAGAWRAAAVLKSMRPYDYFAFLVILVVVIAMVAPGLLTSYGPLQPDQSATLASPSLSHPLGTDYLGRDLWSRVVYGTARTLLASAVAVLVGLGGGTVLGLMAAYFKGVVDTVISRFIEVLLSIPGLLLSMVIIVALGFGEMNAALAVGIASVAVFTRLMRSEVLTIKGLPFVEASHHIGGSQWHVLRRHIFPNSYGAVLSLTALQFGLAILWIAGLSFLGFGAPPPAPQWGLMIAEGRNYVVSSPWMVFAPGIAITLTVLAFSRIGQLIKERLS